MIAELSIAEQNALMYVVLLGVVCVLGALLAVQERRDRQAEAEHARRTSPRRARSVSPQVKIHVDTRNAVRNLRRFAAAVEQAHLGRRRPYDWQRDESPTDPPAVGTPPEAARASGGEPHRRAMGARW